MSEQLCLKWNEFQENIHQTFGSLRNSREFADVTLVCEDGQQMEAHKVILASSSPFFQKMLERLKHPHPLIYMRGLTPEDLVAMLDFLYYGEANVHQEKVENFLLIADDLQIKGLTGNAKDDDQNQFDQEQLKIKKIKVPKNHDETNPGKTTSNLSNIKIEGTSNLFEKIENKKDNYNNSWFISKKIDRIKYDNYDYIQSLDKEIESLMAKSDQIIRVAGVPRRAYTCKICGKEGQGRNIKHHIEINHIEGINIPCTFCEEKFKSRSSLFSHMRKAHKQ